MIQQRFLSNTSGFTLIEVLIAIAIFSIGLMAVGAMQARSLMDTGDVARKTEAWTALEQQVAILKDLPFYVDNPPTTFPAALVDDGNWRTAGYLNNRYTVHWLVNDDTPIVQQPATLIANVTGGPFTVCKTITVAVTRGNNANTAPANPLGQVVFIKTWAATGMPT